MAKKVILKDEQGNEIVPKLYKHTIEFYYEGEQTFSAYFEMYTTENIKINTIQLLKQCYAEWSYINVVISETIDICDVFNGYVGFGDTMIDIKGNYDGTVFYFSKTYEELSKDTNLSIIDTVIEI